MHTQTHHSHTSLPSQSPHFWARLFPLLGLLGGLALACCQWLIFTYAPTEATLGISQKIFYLHLPLAWWGLFSFFLVFIASIIYLKTKSQFWDALAHSSACVGLLLASLALITGMLWGRTAWGIWWTWDARLTTTLIMCFVYAGYMILRTMDMAPQKRSALCAVVGIVAFLDVPLVFFSARLWSYIHPPKIALEPEMKLTVIACVLSFGLLWLALVSLRCSLALTENRSQTIMTNIMLKH